MVHPDRNPSALSPASADHIWRPLEITPSHNGKLIIGPGVSVVCYSQQGREFKNPHPDCPQVVFLLSESACEVSWKSPAGRKQSRVFRGSEVGFIPKGVRYKVKGMTETQLVILYLGNDWLTQFGPGIIKRVGVESETRLVMLDPLIGGLLATLRRDLVSSCSPVGQIAALGHCLAARLIHALAASCSHPSRSQRKLSAATMQRVAEYVENNLGEPINFKQLAREARLSVSHFGVLFKATLGMTPEHYVLNARLIKAKELILTGDFTVSGVAYRTGFADHSHFSVQFKRLFGAPPKAYLPLVRRV